MPYWMPDRLQNGTPNGMLNKLPIENQKKWQMESQVECQIQW